MLDKDIEKTLVSAERINEVTKRLAQAVTEEYKNKYPIIVGLLKGCIPFMGDLIKHLDFHLDVGFMDVSSYHGNTHATTDVKIEKDLNMPVKDRHILIAEDIVDSGRTLQAVIKLLKYRGARSVEVVTLLDKPEGRAIAYEPRFVGVTIPKLFVVGYGLDYQERYRNLPYVGILKESVYK